MLLSKLDAAEAQLREAIYLYFNKREPVAIHTLACAASQVLANLAASRGTFRLLRNESIIKPEHRGRYFAMIKAPENFFKHADRDPGSTLEFDPDFTEHVLMEACYVHRGLQLKMLYEGLLFCIWYFLQYPDFLLECEFKRVLMMSAQQLQIEEGDRDLFAQLLAMKNNLPPETKDYVK